MCKSVQSLLLSIMAMLLNWILLCPLERRMEFNTKLERRNQPSKVAWLNQLEGDWNKMLYKTALDWSQKEVPADVAELLVDVSA